MNKLPRIKIGATLFVLLAVMAGFADKPDGSWAILVLAVLFFFFVWFVPPLER